MTDADSDPPAWVRFPYVVSLGVVTLRFESRRYRVRSTDARYLRGIPYLVASVLFGWWGGAVGAGAHLAGGVELPERGAGGGRAVRTLTAMMVLAGPATAGLYSLDAPCPFEVKPDGTARPLPHPDFNARLTDRETPAQPFDPLKVATWAWAAADDAGRPFTTPAGERVARVQGGGRVAQRLAARWPKADGLQGADLLSHSAALVEAGQPQAALNLLDRRRVGQDYALRANRAHAFAAAGEWADAVELIPDEPAVPPVPPPGTSAEQFAWQRKLDRTAYREWVKRRATDAAGKRSPADPTQTPLPLFRAADGRPIRYWEGKDEAADLPADAAAQVQQLLLWEPTDNLLRWTLAEVYAAAGNVRGAEAAYQSLTSRDGRNFGGPRLLDGLRKRVGDEFAKLPPDDAAVTLPDRPPPPPTPEEKPNNLVFGLIDPLAFVLAAGLFAVMLAAMLALQVRAAVRRRRVNGSGSPPPAPPTG